MVLRVWSGVVSPLSSPLAVVDATMSPPPPRDSHLRILATGDAERFHPISREATRLRRTSCMLDSDVNGIGNTVIIDRTDPGLFSRYKSLCTILFSSIKINFFTRN